MLDPNMELLLRYSHARTEYLNAPAYPIERLSTLGKKYHNIMLEVHACGLSRFLGELPAQIMERYFRDEADV